MTTIVNTPAATTANHETTSGSMMNLIVGIFIVLLLAAFFLYVGLPIARNVGTATQAPQVNVPDKINVDVNTPQQGGGNQSSQ